MKDIGTALVTNLNLLTEFSRSNERTAEWWNHIKADLETPSPTLLPFEKGSNDASNKLSHWEEMQQGFQQYHNMVSLYIYLLPPPVRLISTLGKLGKQPLSRTPCIVQHGLTMWMRLENL